MKIMFSKILPLLIALILCNHLFADVEDTVRIKIPENYYKRCNNEGKTQLFEYKTANSKNNAIVYTPYGYNPDDKQTRYSVLFLMHGGGGTAVNYIGVPGAPNPLCWIIDNAISNGDIDPIIIVCTNGGVTFFTELKKYLLPEIDKNFNTKADRNNRAFGGFSMGSVATWNVFMNEMELIRNFIPMCGDSWIYGNTGGKLYPDKTAKILSRANKITEYPDFKIFAATGTGDTAYPNLTPQIQSMKKLTETFTYTTKDFSNGNLIYYVVEGNVHSYSHTYEYLYNALKLFFPGSTVK